MSKDISDLWMQLREKFETPLTPRELEIASFYEKAYQQLQQENERLKADLETAHRNSLHEFSICGQLKDQIADLTAKLAAAERENAERTSVAKLKAIEWRKLQEKILQLTQESEQKGTLVQCAIDDAKIAAERIRTLEGLLREANYQVACPGDPTTRRELCNRITAALVPGKKEGV